MVSKKSCYVIAEAGVNHNGSLETALKLVDVASEAGADAIKFQTFVPEKLVNRNAETVAYQRRNTKNENQLTMLRRLVLERDFHPILLERCRELSIDFLSTPFDQESAEFLVKLGVNRIKIPSGEITNLPLLSCLAKNRLPIILSTGMSTLDEVKVAVDHIQNQQSRYAVLDTGSPALTLLHCTSNYPTEISDVNLRAMVTMGEKLNLPVGYSDHTLSTLIPAVAVGMGASIVEKHFTLDRMQAGPDHAASLEPKELRKMIDFIREVEVALGDGVKEPRKSEYDLRDLVRRSLVSTRDIAVGDVIRREDIAILRPGTGIPPYEIERVIGKTVRRKVNAGSLIQWLDLELN